MTSAAVHLARHADAPALELAPALLQDADDLAAAHHTSTLIGGRCPLGFKLFILVNAVLFVRPAEIVPGWENLPIYQCLILACLLASLPVVLPQLAWSSLRKNPITVCVLGLLVAIVLSHLSHGDIYDARVGATDFSKIVIYYLLLVGLVDSPARLRLFLLIITSFILCVALLALLNHHGWLDIPALSELQESYGEDSDGGEGTIMRLRAMGIFNDPNDFCLILNAAIFICLHWLIGQRRRIMQVAWALPIVPLVYAITLTQSRGGFLSLLVGLAVLLFTRISKRRAVLICVILIPCILLAFAGRLTNMDLNNSDDTAQGRIHLWRDSLVLFHQSPLLGNGYETLSDEIGFVAHNSYVHSYAELGFFGGTLFVGAFYLAVTGIGSLRFATTPSLSSEFRSLRLCLLPVLAAYMVGIYSLSRCYINTTYMTLGLAASFLALVASYGGTTISLNKRVFYRVSVASAGCIVFFEVFVRILAR